MILTKGTKKTGNFVTSDVLRIATIDSIEWADVSFGITACELLTNGNKQSSALPPLLILYSLTTPYFSLTSSMAQREYTSPPSPASLSSQDNEAGGTTKTTTLRRRDVEPIRHCEFNSFLIFD